MLFLVGLGLGDAKDITIKGLEVVKRAKKVYLEAYTSILTVGKAELVSCYVLVHPVCCNNNTQRTSAQYPHKGGTDYMV